MTRFTAYCTLLSAFFLFGCQSDEDKESLIESKKGEVASEIQDTQTNNDVLETEWRFFEGDLGNMEQQVVIELGFTGLSLSGRYFYARQQKFLTLTGKLDTLDTNNLNIKLIESYKGKVTGYLTGRLREDGSLEGNWFRTMDGEPEPFIVSPISLSSENREQMLVSFWKYERPHTILTHDGVSNQPKAENAIDEIMLSDIDARHFAFYYNVLGPNYHVGSVEGIATRVEDDYAIFKSPEDGCMLSFKFENDSLFIEEEEDCSFYRGIGVNFGNRLKKVR